ncbi:MAG: glycosyltransferase family 4 protein, partial [Kiritimatiellae bacterium]|nr:glycosyltransferase family 4 protein [Kiritimatiellia bacterium]
AARRRPVPAAGPELGVTLAAPLSLKYSNSKTARDFAWGLRAAGLPFQTFDTNRRPEIPPQDCAPILTPRGDFDPRRFTHVVEMFRSPFPDGLAPRRARIAFWEGETGMLDVFPYLASPHPVIAMSDFNAEWFRRELPASTPVFKIVYPLPLDVSGFAPQDETRARFGIPPDAFAVFYNFDLGAWGRKNPEAAVRAFALAFRGDHSARLVLKVKWAERFRARAADLVRIAAAEGVGDRLVVVDGYLSRADLHGLAAACDVYFSPHRAEGFGIGIAEAMLLGKPVVATDWSATTEFCRPEHCFPVPCRLVPVKPGEYFESMRRWAEIDVDAAADALRRLRADAALRGALGARARGFVLSHFSPAAFRADVERFLQCTT